MALKFELKFQNAEQIDCVVNFFFDNYDGNPMTLYGGPRPFVLGEFNTDENLFKPIRAQQATIEILASASGVKLEDFLQDQDKTVQVRFDYGQFNSYWFGYLSQEDMSETWMATNHILVLRADDGFGRLKNVSLADNDGKNLLGTFDFIELMTYAMRGAVVNLSSGRIFSNLFHSSMNSSANQTGLDQCTTDARTFERDINDFDDQYTVIEKINKSWNQQVFQYLGQSCILRIPEQFNGQNLRGFLYDEAGRYAINQRYDIEVGVNETVKPVMPEMLKTFFKPQKLKIFRSSLKHWKRLTP
jgi:hypothetical protein